MGYLINPIGFRVGQTTGWVDTWFFYKNFYPEFLHFVLKLRVFLNFYLDSYPTEYDLSFGTKQSTSLFSGALLFSHYRIFFNLTSVYISLFLYPGKFWDSFYDIKSKKKNLKSFKFISFDFFKKELFFKNNLLKNKKLFFFKKDLKKQFKLFLKNFFFFKSLVPLSFVFKVSDLRKFFSKKIDLKKVFLTFNDVFHLFVSLLRYRGFLKKYIYNKNLLKGNMLVHKFLKKFFSKFGLNLLFLKRKFPFLRLNFIFLKHKKKIKSFKILPFVKFNKKFLNILFSFFDFVLKDKNTFKILKKKSKNFFFKLRKRRSKILLRFSRFFFKYQKGFHMFLLFFFFLNLLILCLI